MSTLEIRPLLPADASSYFALRLEGLRDAPGASWASYEEEEALPLDAIETRLAPGVAQCSFGAFMDGKLVGIASLKHEAIAKIAHRANIWGVYVTPSARMMGVATQLVEAMIVHALRVEVLAQLTLVVNSGNVLAAALYAKLGFVVTGIDRRSTRIDGTYHDELRMVRFLDQVLVPVARSGEQPQSDCCLRR